MNAITRKATKDMPYARGASAFILATSSGECACAAIHCLAKSSGEYHGPPIRKATTAATMMASQLCDCMRDSPAGFEDLEKPERTYGRLMHHGRRGSWRRMRVTASSNRFCLSRFQDHRARVARESRSHIGLRGEHRKRRIVH